MKTGSPAFPPGFMQQLTGMPQMQSSQPPLQRAAIQRQHARRSAHALTPKLGPGQSSADLNFNSTSPQAGPTPSSHVSSPSGLSTRSPIAMQTGGMTPPASGVLAQPQGQHSTQFPRSQQSSLNPVMYQPPQQTSHLQRSQRPGQYQAGSAAGLPKPSNSQPNGQHQNPPGSSGSGGNGTAGSVTPASAFYPSPFQKHIDQLGKLSPPSSLMHRNFVVLGLTREYRTGVRHQQCITLHARPQRPRPRPRQRSRQPRCTSQFARQLSSTTIRCRASSTRARLWLPATWTVRPHASTWATTDDATVRATAAALVAEPATARE